MRGKWKATPIDPVWPEWVRARGYDILQDFRCALDAVIKKKLVSHNLLRNIEHKYIEQWHKLLMAIDTEEVDWTKGEVGLLGDLAKAVYEEGCRAMAFRDPKLRPWKELLHYYDMELVKRQSKTGANLGVGQGATPMTELTADRPRKLTLEEQVRAKVKEVYGP